jgi:type I restriction enzyme S subunit
MKGWEIKKLGEVCDLQNGFAFKSRDYIDFSNTMNFRMSQIRPDGRIDLDNNPKYLPNDYAVKYKEYLLKEGDVVIAMTDMATETKILGIPAIVPKDLRNWLLNQRVGKLFNINKSKINITFLKYILGSETINEYYKSLGRGGLQINIGKQDILNVEIPIPLLSEQKHIVEILDATFAAIDKAKVNVEKNLQNAKELFESYLQNVFANKGEDWEEKRLADITEVKDGTHDSPQYIKEGIPFVTQKNIRQEGLSFADTKFINDDDHKKFYKRSNVAYGDILISMIGANRGMAAIVDDKRIFSIKNVGLIKSNDKINKHFLLYYLKSPVAMQYVMYMSNGGAQEFVGLTSLRSFPIPYPKLNEQNFIVEKLDILSNETKKLEAIYQQKLNDLEELKKSILQKAFSGELTAKEMV